MISRILRSRSWLAVIALAFVLPAIGSAEAGETGEEVVERSAPDIVVFLTDDQRADTLRYMPNVNRLLVDRGVTFTNGYVVNPVCCPSRASILTGNYSHTTKVYTNHASQPYGGFPAFRDGSTIATWLDDAGYRTGLLGKYLNGYKSEYVPPGWDRWFATYGKGAYFDYTAVSDGVEQHYGSEPSDYGTSVLRREAVAFIRSTDPSESLFMLWASHGPHKPATPERRDRTSYASLSPWRPPNYDEANVSDKPAHVQARATIDRPTAREMDEFRLDQIRALQAVDRAVAQIVETLRDTGRLRNTMIVFTSDNGMMWGEHRLDGKGEIYEESISVPFVVRYDALVDRARTDDHLVLNIDLAPTFTALADVDAPAMEGRSLLGLLDSTPTTWRDAFLIEHMGRDRGRNAPTFCAVHTDRYVLVRYATGEEELYDLSQDPLQMVNRAASNRYQERRRTLRQELKALCDPLPPGFSF